VTSSTRADSEPEEEPVGENSVGAACCLERETSRDGRSDAMTSRPDSADDDSDVSVTSSAVTSPSSRELKFGIERILIDSNAVKGTSSIGTELVM